MYIIHISLKSDKNIYSFYYRMSLNIKNTCGVGAHKGSYQGIKKETPQTAVSGYAEKYVRVVHVSRSELSTSQVSEMRDAVATDLH